MTELNAPSGVFDAIAATALAGLLWESTKAYRAACPPLTELRDCPANDPTVLQALVDADITVGIPALLAGIIVSWLMRSWLPIFIVGVAFAATAGYHHSILSDPND